MLKCLFNVFAPVDGEMRHMVIGITVFVKALVVPNLSFEFTYMN